MGNETRCTVTVGKTSGEGKALLETEELIFRADDKALRLVIRFGDVKKIAAVDGVLAVTFGEPSRTARFALGVLAPKWAEKIQRPRSRAEKLGVKAGASVALIGVDDEAFADELRARGAQVERTPGTARDAIFFHAETAKDLTRLSTLRKALAPAGALWLLRAKGPAAKVTEQEGMDAGKKAGLVDVKVVRFSEVLTAEKFVIPVAKR